ncbi:MAG: hypothetical protein EBZ59_06535 [Planctomycetia bacterium]|nr:hypothetical protein [Planctomycetia bacterium]
MWQTTASDRLIEIWATGFSSSSNGSVFSVSSADPFFLNGGKYFAELNATQISTLYQEVTASKSGLVSYSFWTRGRQASDTMGLRIDAEIGKTWVPIYFKQFTTAPDAWVNYQGEKIAAVRAGTKLRFNYVSIAGSTTSIGNFLDNAAFGILDLDAPPLRPDPGVPEVEQPGRPPQPPRVEVDPGELMIERNFQRVLAFRLVTGETAWKATDEQAGYSSPVTVAVGGEPHVLMVTRLSCLLLDSGGAVRWRFPFGQRGPTVNAANPVVIGGDRLLVTASYGIGSVCAAFDKTGCTTHWEGTETLATQYCTPVECAGRLYAIDGRDDLPPTALKCIDSRSGRVEWSEENFGYGTLLVADGRLLVAKTDGEILLVRPDPAGPAVLARARVVDGTLRALPALAGGRLYLRDDRTLVCLDLGP